MNTPPLNSTVQGVLIGLATALIGVLLTQTHGIDLTFVEHATVVQCNR